MIIELATCLIVLFLVYQLYVYKKIHYHFKKWGIKYKPGIPMFGNTFCSFFGLKHIVEDLGTVYSAFPEERYVGFMEGMKPVILVKDPELIKSVTIKDFDHFVNRKIIFPKEIEPLLGSSLLNMRDEEWRKMRSRLTAVFSAAKMKTMVPSMIETSNNIVKFLKDRSAEDIDVLELMRRFNTDVIASTGFGVHVNSFKDRNNEFYRIGKEAVEFPVWRRVYHFLTLQFPVLAKTMQILGIQLLPSKGMEFFRKIVAETMTYRKKNNITRPDFIQLLMEDSEDWTLDDITGQIYFAFLSSYESSATTLTMCIHELALHPECQERLYQEIIDLQKNVGEVTLDTFAELKYMDCVLQETTRKWSVALILDRICSKNYMMPPPREGGNPYLVERGTMVYNVVNCIHTDSKYHYMPDVFNPDRFSVDNKQDIKSFTFMPFGTGPRSCLGMRYAMLKMKVLLYHLILNYQIVKCEKTVDPLLLKPHEFSIQALGDTYVQFKARM